MTLFFGIEDQDRKPIINLSEYDISTSPDAFVQKIERLRLTLMTLKQILPFLLQKYPVLRTRFEDFIAAIKLMVEYCKPIIDGRWDRSWPEWQQIQEYADTFGPRAASKKFYAIKDGKRQHLSPTHIRQKIKSVREFERKLEAILHLEDYFKQLINIVNNDSELLEKCKQIGKEYAENNTLATMQSHDRGNKSYSYTYYYVRHYDPKIYQKRMSDYKKGKIKKSQVTGKLECGPIEENKIPKVALEKLQFNEKIRLYSKLVFILSFQPTPILFLAKIMETETKDMIKALLGDLIETGTVKQICLNTKKPEICDGLNENSITSVSDEDMYYIIDKSNTNVPLMLEDYKRHSTGKEIQSIVKKISEYHKKISLE